MTMLSLPRRTPGRKSPEREAFEREADLALCRWLEQRWRGTGFAFGSRGWGYVCEGEGFINKGELDAFESWLTRVRKEGLLNPDVVSDDDARAADNVEEIDADDPAAAAAEALDLAEYSLSTYAPLSIWEGLDVYLEVLVEKVDLKILFNGKCKRYGIILINAKGSSDLNARRRMLQRFKKQHKAGRRCILLYFGDHDPPGIRIADVIKQNLLDCARVQDVGWDPSPVEVVRFGLTPSQIKALSLPWIDNLITGSGKDSASPTHPDHHKPYVQDYIGAHGIRKVEANALAAHPAEAAALIEQAINQYVPRDWPDRHRERLEPHRAAARRAFADLIARGWRP